MRQRRFLWILLCLLCVAGAWLLWLGRNGSRSRPPKAVAPAARPHLPSTVATTANRGVINTNPAHISLANWSTNKFAGRLSNTTEPIGQLVNDNHAILLQNALIDTRQPLDFVFPKHLQSQGDPGAYIVQANGPINDAFRAMLAQAGATIIAYIPNDAYLVRATASVANMLGANPLAQAVIPYEPYYKIQPSLLRQAVNQTQLPDGTALNLALFGNDSKATIAQIEKLGGQVIIQEQSPFGPEVRVLPPKDWTTLATLPGVQIVERFHPRKVANDLSRATVGVAADSLTPTNYLGLTGTNIVVEVNDTGIDAQHPDLSGGGFYNKLTPGVIGDAPQSLVDTNGHGTHVAGIIAGDGEESTTVTNAPGSTLPGGTGTNYQFRGMAPGATLYSVGGIEGGADTNLITDQYLQEAPALTNALISNNSWVYEGDNLYDLAAASYDAAVRDALPTVTGSQPVLFVFAAGNAGNGNDGSDPGAGVADSIESPATAKNVITVGAIQEDRNITNLVTTVTVNSDGTTTTNTDEPWQAETSTSNRVAGFSSRGNVGIGIEGTYGRFKPDVVAPGTFIISTRSEQWDIGDYFYQNPTNHQTQTYSDLIVQPGSTFVDAFPSVPTNAVQLAIDVYPNARSPVPFPDLPIYVGLFSSAGYDFVGANDPLLIPGDPNAPGGYLQAIFNTEGLNPFLGAFNYAVSNNTANPISFGLETDILTTNGAGDYYLVLSNLNNSIGTPNGSSTGPGPYYRYESGTSMSAADVSGMLALMQEFYQNAYGVRPSPAMLKAMLINGSQVTGTAYDYHAENTINYEGWGLVNLPNSLPPGVTNQLGVPCSEYVQDQNPTNALATGDRQTLYVSTTNSLSLRVTLAWTDPPGDPAAAIKLVNSLELVVTNLSNPTNPIVYYGNDIPAGSTYNSPSQTNTPPNFDAINNVQTVNLQRDTGTNFSITVLGHRVNVNAVTAQTNTYALNGPPDYAPNIVQDYALAISYGNGQVTNAMTVSSTPVPSTAPPVVISNPTGDQQISVLSATNNNAPLLNQLVGASSPLLGTNTVPIGTIYGLDTNNAPIALSPGFASTNNAVVTVGMTNQWHFYVVTNTFAATNSAYTNAAFVIFNPNAPQPNTLATPREGVFAGTVDNASRDADIDLYVSTQPGLTNLDPNVISNCVNGGTQIGISSAGGNFNGASLGRGSTEFVVDIGSKANEIYYIGVKSEDQMAAEYGFISIFSATPFSQMKNGNQFVNGVPVPVNIPDGSPKVPGKGFVFGLAIYPMTVGQVGVADEIVHQNLGDLIGTLTLNGGHADVLNNHDSFVGGGGAYAFSYNDTPGGVAGTRPSDGPGSLNGFIGRQAIGVWQLTEADTALSQIGYVNSYNLTIQPHRNLEGGVTATVPGKGWFYDYIDVPPGATNLTIYATNISATISSPSLELFVKYGSEPTTNDTEHMAILDPGGSVSLGPPLESGRYYVGVYNPSTSDQTFYLIARVGLGVAPGQAIFSSADTPKPILDDAVTTDSIYVPNNQIISSLDVGLAVQHPRISDLVFHLISPDGTRDLLMENRGGTSTNGAGGMNVTTNVPPDTNYSYLMFTEDTNLTTTPIKFAPPPFVPGPSNLVWSDSFEADAVANYTATNNATFGEGWTVLTNQVTITNSPNAFDGSNFLALDNGAVSIDLPTVANHQYQLTYEVGTNDGTSNNWQAASVSFTATRAGGATPLVLDASGGNYAAGTLVVTNFGPNTVFDDFKLLELSGDLYYLPEQPLDTYDGKNAGGWWRLEIQDDRAGATNPLPQLLSWQLRFTFVTAGTNVAGLPPGTTATNVIPANSWVYYRIDVPTNADQATNLLAFATGPLNMWFNPTNNPIGSTPPDNLLLGGATSGDSVLTTFSVPTNIVPGGVYYIGLQNTNNYQVTNGFEVDFQYFQITPVPPGVPITNTVPGTIQGDGVDYYSFAVPTNVDYATNLLLSSTVPVNVWFNQTKAPVCLSPPDSLLISNATSGVSILSGVSTPPLRPGSTYNLAVQNTNVANATYTLKIDYHFTTTLPPGVPETNTVPTNSFVYYSVTVPTNADYATNLLLFADLPVNVWFNQNVSPTGTNAGDYLLIPNATNGVSVLSAGSTPLLVPGATYYLGVQNTNNMPVTFGLEVNFHLVIPTGIASGPFLTYTNINGTNGILLRWFAQTSYQYQIQWTARLAPPIDWTTIPGVVLSYLPGTAINGIGEFQYFDDGSLTGGFGTQKFYRLIAYPPGTTVPPALVISSVQAFSNGGVQIQWAGSTNYQYDVQWTTNLALPTASWNVLSNLASPTLTYSGGVFTFSDPVGALTGGVADAKFFRVLLLP